MTDDIDQTCIFPDDVIKNANSGDIDDILDTLESYGAELPSDRDALGLIERRELALVWSRDETVLLNGFGEGAIIRREAEEILLNGDPIEMFQKTFKTLHVGDVEVLNTILCAQCAQQALTTDGIQPVLSGSKGAGKTSAVKAALHLTPKEYLLSGSFSDKSMFHNPRLRSGCVVFSDDVVLSPDIISTIKRAMSNFQEITQHTTLIKVNKQLEVQELFIPSRVVFIFTSVHDVGDDQLSDRQYRISIEQSKESDKKYAEFLLKRLSEGRMVYPESHEVKVCREILKQIKKHVFRVKIPFANRIHFNDLSGKRNMGTFADFIQASAILHYMQRELIDDESGPVLCAIEEDFEIAKEMFQANAKTRKYDLTKAEHALLEFIILMGGEITEQEIIEKYSKGGENKTATRMQIRRLLNGRDGKGGLCEKVPGLTVTKESRKVDEGQTIRQVNVIKAPEKSKTVITDYGTWVSLEKVHNGSGVVQIDEDNDNDR